MAYNHPFVRYQKKNYDRAEEALRAVGQDGSRDLGQDEEEIQPVG